jgi:hypothetical protein
VLISIAPAAYRPGDPMWYRYSVRRLRPAIVVAIVAFACGWAVTASATHDQSHPFAGEWTISFASGRSGTFTFRLVGDAEGLAAMNAAFATAPCAEPSDYYVGTYVDRDQSGTIANTGSLAGCTTTDDDRSIYAPYSPSSGVCCGFVTASLDASGETFSGTNYWDFDGDAFAFTPIDTFEGTFAAHVPGDGAEEPPDPCAPRAASGPGGGDECAPPPKCLGKPATIVANDENAGGGALEGTEGDDVILGFPGRPLTISGRGGDDRICGGSADDVIRGGDGNDHLSGGGGSDLLNGEGGNDRLLGGGGADTLLGFDGVDALFGGAGDDDLGGGAGPDLLVGQAGTDFLAGEAGDDHATGGPGDDRLNGDVGDDLLDGGSGADALRGDAGDDELDGGRGADSLLGGSGDDELDGGPREFDKIVNGGPGSDICRGNSQIRLGCEKPRQP